MLPLPANAPAFRRGVRSVASIRGFTLIELLTVIAIIGLLAAMTLGIVSGVNARAAIGQAKSELATLAQALESYKRQYGDYPQTGAFSQSTAAVAGGPGTATAEAKFFNALTGKLGPAMASIKGRNFIELAKFTLEAPYSETATTEQDNAFLDPWGRRYHYYYRSTGTTSWTAPTYVLYSCGPDGDKGDTAPAATGIVDYTASNNSDNIYANKN